MNQVDYLHGKLFPMILRFSIPAAISLLITAIYNIVDRMFVGNVNGTSALAGLSVCFPLSYLMMAFGLMCSAGGSTFFSLFSGQAERKRMNLAFGNAFVLVCGFEILLTVFLLVLADPLLVLFGVTDTAYPYPHQHRDVARHLEPAADNKGDDQRGGDGGADDGQRLAAHLGDLGEVEPEPQQDDRILQYLFGGKGDARPERGLVLEDQRCQHAQQNGEHRPAHHRESAAQQPAGDGQRQAQQQARQRLFDRIHFHTLSFPNFFLKRLDYTPRSR